jgi:uncharacterized Zn ribbon protein
MNASITQQTWHGALHTTLDCHHTVALIASSKAKQLAQEMTQHDEYYLCLQAGYDVEIVRVLKVKEDVVTLLRGQRGTAPNIWPAGTWLRSNISVSSYLPRSVSRSWDLYY